MTLVIAIADQSNQFDMRVKSCFAHDGVKPPVQLTDEYGCVLRKSMLSEFSKIKGGDFRKNLGENAVALNGYLGKATVISYAHFYVSVLNKVYFINFIKHSLFLFFNRRSNFLIVCLVGFRF